VKIRFNNGKEGQFVREGYPTFTLYRETENPFNDKGVVDDAVSIIKSREKSDKPWCQFIGKLEPHDPYVVPRKYLDMYDIDDFELPLSHNDKMSDKPGLYRT